MSKLHREQVWSEERITEMEIMVMMKLGKCPEDWVTEVESTTHHRRVRSRNPKLRGQSNKIIVCILKTSRIMADAILKITHDSGTIMVKK